MVARDAKHSVNAADDYSRALWQCQGAPRILFVSIRAPPWPAARWRRVLSRL